MPRGQKTIVGGDLNGHGGDLNGHVDRKGNRYKDAHGGYGFRERNNDGKAILDFAMAYELIIANTRFKK